ncbi:MAG: N utilization substance protein B [Legionellales bacterium RIFCSPHIGHO2_12_FULL_42_9]|nr:MAG: N utilization substance protein B [Legionellales bacterium RIFCSPHIGHO2_12_FULL_42_9]
MDKQPIRRKQRARKLALQAMYQWMMAGHDIAEIEAQFHQANSASAMEKVDTAYFSKIIHEVPKHLVQIEATLLPFLDRPLDDLTPIELTVLRMGTYELLFCLDIPYRIVLDEWVTLAKEFGSAEGHRYVNGVLNNLARQVRAAEVKLPK